MDFFQNRYFRINVVLLTLCGLWHYQKIKPLQTLQRIVCPIIVTTVMAAQGVKLFEAWGDVDIMIDCLTPMGVQFGAVVKFFNSIIYQKKMKLLLQTIKRDWSEFRNDAEIEILTRYAQEGRVLTIVYAAFMALASIVYLLIPLLPRFLDVILPLNESRPYEFMYQTEYHVDPVENYLWICAHTYSCIVITMTSIVAADAMFFVYIMHCCGVLAVIGYRLENLTEKHLDVDTDGMSKNNHVKCYQELVFCIDKHYKATQYANILESCYTSSYFIILGVGLFLMSISAVQLLIKLGNIKEVVRLVPFFAGQCTHLLFNSWPCQRLIDQSTDFRISLYAAEWYSFSEENKNLLRFIMLRSIEPMKISAGKFYIMSIENFGVFMQSAMSYFTVFASVR